MILSLSELWLAKTVQGYVCYFTFQNKITAFLQTNMRFLDLFYFYLKMNRYISFTLREMNMRNKNQNETWNMVLMYRICGVLSCKKKMTSRAQGCKRFCSLRTRHCNAEEDKRVGSSRKQSLFSKVVGQRRPDKKGTIIWSSTQPNLTL